MQTHVPCIYFHFPSSPVCAFWSFFLLCPWVWSLGLTFKVGHPQINRHPEWKMTSWFHGLLHLEFCWVLRVHQAVSEWRDWEKTIQHTQLRTPSWTCLLECLLFTACDVWEIIQAQKLHCLPEKQQPQNGQVDGQLSHLQRRCSESGCSGLGASVISYLSVLCHMSRPHLLSFSLIHTQSLYRHFSLPNILWKCSDIRKIERITQWTLTCSLLEFTIQNFSYIYPSFIFLSICPSILFCRYFEIVNISTLNP